MNQKELAKSLGISQMTVSRVLNNKPGAGKKLRSKIMKAVKQSGYIHDHVAAGLRANSTRIIGLVIPDVAYSFFPDITKSIEESAARDGYNIILAHSHSSYIEESRQIALLLGLKVSGLIIAPAGKQNELEIYQKLQKRGVPFVFIDRIKNKINCSSVVSDIEEGAAGIIGYLLDKGYKSPGYLAGPYGVSSSDEHFKGIKKGLKRAGINPELMTTSRAGFTEIEGYNAAEKLLGKCTPDVIIAANDLVAIGAYKLLREKGIMVPKEIALAGFSDLAFSDLLAVPLTTVRENTNEIGKRAIETLMQKIENPDIGFQQIVIKTELIIRKSA